MAILGDLLVQGRSRFLQKIYAASLDIGEDTTIAGTLTLSKTNDAIGTSNNSPALVVGGTATTAHLELDNNEIMAKTNGTTAADIYINADGGVVYIGKSGIKTQIQGNLQVQGTSTFTGASTHSGNLTVSGTTSLAGTSVSSDLNVANNAKVNGVLTVEEEIRSPKWIVDNIANLGGEFIIAPTIVCENNTSVNISGPSNNLYTITVTDGSITSNTFGGIAWSTGSVVKISGTINDTVLVSINGTMTRALNQTTGTIQFTVSSSNITLTAGTYTGTKVKNLHIMMYKVGNVAPVGIFMTSYGQSHYPYIDIYSGTTSGSFYSPTTRLGYLNGLTDENGNALKINNISPTGWGLYTSNGYFSGTIVSTSGKIGGFNLDTTKIYSGTNSISSTTVGVYLGTDGIRNYNSASQSVTIKNGVITAIGADVSGKITATSGEIGGFAIDSSSIHTKNVAVTSNADNSISLSSTDFTRTINGTSRAGLRFAIGDKFGVTGDGILYTNGANITNINASNISAGTVSVGVLPESVKNENIEIGGRNFLRNTNWTPETIEKFKMATSTTNVLGNAIGEWYKETQTTLGFDTSGLMMITVPDSNTRYGIYQDVSLSPGHYILSVDTGSFFKSHIDSVQWPAKNGIDGSDSRNSVEIDVVEKAIYRVYIAYNNGAVMYGNYMKLEKGTKATDWTPAPEDQEALITNTRTWYATCSTAAATTAKEATTTDSGFVLKEGVVVDVKFTNTNTGAVGSLTLNVNGTGAKSIKTVYNDSLRDIINAGQLYANSIIHFVYNGTYWIAETNYNSDNDSNAMYVRYYNTILAGEALQASSIIGGRADGKFYQIKENSSFDLAHPLLWTTRAIPSGGTNFANIYMQCYDINLGTYYTSFTNTTKNCLVYLVGTVSGNTFTTYGANSASYLTVTPPTTADGRFYIPIGRLGNSSNGKNYFNFQVSTPVALYAYIDGKFRQVTPTDIVATQRIYYRSNSSTKPNGTGLPTTWVTENGNKFNTNATTAAGWSKKVSPMTSDGVTGSGKYIYLWTCEQRKRLDGTIDYTEILLDDSTTIIDGGNIITGSIVANKIQAGSITADRLNTTSINSSGILTLNAFASTTQSDILNSNVEVGGRNLVRWSTSPEYKGGNVGKSSDSTGWYAWNTSTTGVINTTEGIKCVFTGNSTGLVIPLVYDNAVLGDETLTISFDYKGTLESIDSIYLLTRSGGNVVQSGSNPPGLIVSETNWQHYEYTFKFASLGNRGATHSILLPYTSSNGKWFEIKNHSFKLEKGNKATDWTPAPEDVSASLSLKANKDTLTTEINASADTVKINADRVNIEGAAIFSSGRLSQTSLNNAYDAKGAAAAVQTNLNNLSISSTNLIRNSDFSNGSNYWQSQNVTFSVETDSTYGTCGKIVFSSAGSNSVRIYPDVTTNFTHETNKTYSLSFYAKASNTNTIKVGRGGIDSDKYCNSVALTTSWKYITATITATSTGSLTFALGSAGTLYLTRVMLVHGDKPVDWSIDPRDITSANAREQIIYHSAVANTTSMAATQVWVTDPANGGGGQNVWTTIRPEYNSQYPVLFVAMQRQTVAQVGGTTCTCTTPTIDKTTTVIDGGHITTGTIDTNRLNADTIKSNIVQTTELNADKITSGTIATARIAAGSIAVGKIDATSGTFNTANIPDLNASKITAGDISADRIKTNVVSAIQAVVTDLQALVAKIGGFTLDATSIRTAALTSNADNSIGLSTADFTRTINGTSRAGLRMAFGDKFGVTGDGAIFASSANVSGTITATAGTIGGASISNGVLKVKDANIDGTISGSHIDASSISIGSLNGASDYATKTDAQGYANAKDDAIAAAAKRTDVVVAVTAIDYDLGTATLQATLYIDGTATTSNVTYKWLKDGSVISGQTARTLSITAAMGLSHVYSCTVTYS